MPERALGGPLRLLIGFVGAAALFAGFIVTAAELRWLALGSPALPILGAIVVSMFVMLGGLHLVRGALRGRIVVRRTGFSRSTHQNGRR